MCNCGLAAIRSLLNKNGRLDEDLGEIIRSSYFRLLDTKSIVESGSGKPPVYGTSNDRPASYTRTQFETIGVAEHEIKLAREEGLGPHLYPIVSSFGALLLEMAANQQQRGNVLSWVFGHKGAGCFLMTDTGGPDIRSWESKAVSKGNEIHIRVSKKYAIMPPNSSFGLLLAQKEENEFSPGLYLLPPDVFKTLAITPSGMSWLDGNIELGDVAGEVKIDRQWQMLGAGIGATRRFLSLCRPRIVLAFMAHIDWLRVRKRVRTSDAILRSLENLRELATTLTTKPERGRLFAAEAMAIKFASNELILQLIVEDQEINPPDRRDLLGFTKMEGSSYRCYTEISAMAGIHRARSNA